MADSEKQFHDAPRKPLSLRQRMLRRLIAGVLFVLPALITILVIYQIFLMIQNWIIEPVAMVIVPPKFENKYWQTIDSFVAPLFSLVVVFGGLYLAGYLFQTRIRDWINWLFSHVPGVSTIYTAILDVLDSYRGPDGLKKIDKVVIVPFPTERARTAGYLMTETSDEETGEELVCVYIPLALFPPSGYTLVYPKEDVIMTEWDAAEGWKFLLSAGLTLPPAMPYQLRRAVAKQLDEGNREKADG